MHKIDAQKSLFCFHFGGCSNKMRHAAICYHLQCNFKPLFTENITRPAIEAKLDVRKTKNLIQ